MRVCNVCFGLPAFNGVPSIDNTDTGNDQYLFGDNFETGEVDLCSACLMLFQSQSWDKIAERANDVLMLRLGATAPDTRKRRSA